MYTPSFVEVLIIGLAVNQIIEVWRHSTLFQRLRYDLQVWQHESTHEPSFITPIANFIPNLLLCNWCFSIWVALVVVGIFIWGNWIGWWVVMTLGVSRIANLINDVLYFYIRTPKYDAGQTLTYPTNDEIKEEWEKMNAEMERHKRETKPPSCETEDPQSETTTRGFEPIPPTSPNLNEEVTFQSQDEKTGDH